MTKEQFLARVGNWDNHRYLLWEALESTKHLKLPVLELGCGMGSTEWLRKYCADEGLEFFSYDSNEKYAKEFDSVYVENWETIAWRKEYSVVLNDLAPGEYRKIAIPKLQNSHIIISHDTEPAAEHGYQMRPELLKFKYSIDFTSAGAWATASSNTINVNLWKL